LVEERFGKPVRRGQLLYQNRSLEVPFDDRLRTQLLDAIAELKSAEVMADVARNHCSPARCRGCGFRPGFCIGKFGPAAFALDIDCNWRSLATGSTF
jgi:CRISPR/Cas system-associated exonuclease Cas4 (RecB family)